MCNGCMPVRAVCKPHSPCLKRGALATDARGCILWRSLLECPPPALESRVRDPLGEWVRTRVGGGVTHAKHNITDSSLHSTLIASSYFSHPPLSLSLSLSPISLLFSLHLSLFSLSLSLSLSLSFSLPSLSLSLSNSNSKFKFKFNELYWHDLNSIAKALSITRIRNK